jgi:hypothetical protein
MVKKMVAEGVDFSDADEIVRGLMREGKKVTIDPLDNKFWVFDLGKPRR